MEAPIRILLVDDHDILRKGLRYLLGAHPQYQVVGEASEGITAVQMAEELKPDVILMDLEMPFKSGSEATAEILRSNPEIHILALTSFVDDSKVIPAAQAGVCGYVTKTSSPDELFLAIQQVYHGGTYFPATIIQQLANQKDVISLTNTLTKRELEVLTLVSEGLSNKDIASQLHLSPKTIEIYVSRLMNKLHLENRTQIALFARNAGLG